MKPLSPVPASRRKTPKCILHRSAAALLTLSSLLGMSAAVSAQIRAVVPVGGVNVTTHHNDNARTGFNGQETRLTPTSLLGGIVEGGQKKVFGKMFERKVDGEIYAQPLYVSNVAVTDPNTGRVILRDVVYVVTNTGKIYAFDADSNVGTYARPYWNVSFDYPAARVSALDASDVDPNYADFGSKISIIGTPVIDMERQALYVVVRTRESLNFRQRLYAFDLATGNQRPNSPQLITGYVSGTGDGSESLDDGTSRLYFDDIFTNKAAALLENQQAALLLQNNKVFVAWGSHADIPPFHGWVMAFDADTLQRVGAFVTTPDGSGGGVSMSGAGIAGDGSNIYVVSGTGTYDQDINSDGDGPFLDGNNLGQSVIKLRVAPSGDLTFADYFTPFNQATLTDNGIDLTTGGIVLLPTSVGSAAHPELLVAGGLEGRVYLLDRTAQSTGQLTRMGRYQPDADSQIVQSFLNAAGAFFGTPAFLPGSQGVPVDQGGQTTGTLFYNGSGDVLKAFTISNGQITTPDVKRSRTRLDFPGATPSISANGVSNAIVWTIGAFYPPTILPGEVPPPPTAYLLAHDASDISKAPLFNSQSLGATNSPGNYANFSVPTIAKGKVFVGAKGRLSVFGFTKPQEARASRFVISGPNYIPGVLFPALSVRAGYNFCITAIGADERPIKLNTTVQIAYRVGTALQSGGSVTFANQSSVIINRAFINPGRYEMIVTDKNGTSSSTLVRVRANTDEGTDRFVLTAKSSASVGEVVALTVRSVSAAGSPTVMYDIATMPAPPHFVPHPFTVYGTRVSGTQDLNFGAPGYVYDALPANRALPAPAPLPQFSDNAGFGIFESVKTVQIQMNEPGEQVIVVTDGFNTGTIKITVR